MSSSMFVFQRLTVLRVGIPARSTFDDVVSCRSGMKSPSLEEPSPLIQRGQRQCLSRDTDSRAALLSTVHTVPRVAGLI